MTKSFVQTFAALMFLALVSAVFLPPRTGGSLGASAQALLLPVTQPMRVVAAWVHAEPAVVVDDTKTPEQWAVENAELQRAITLLQGQLQELSELKSERDRLGKRLRELCTPMKVTGTEAGSNDLLIAVPVGESVEVGDPVLHAGRLVGRVREVGAFGARVRVLTDGQTQLAVAFGRLTGPASFERRRLGESAADTEYLAGNDVVLIEGDDGGTLRTRSQPIEADDGIFPVKVGDTVVLDDQREWPIELTQITVGTVVAVTPRSDSAGWADVIVEPAANVKTISEVMVMNR